MAGSNTFGGTIKLEGEKAYRQAISQINLDLKVLASEMSKVTAEFGKNNTSSSALTSKSKVLNEQIERQKGKIETLRGALEESSEKYGENDKKTNNWKISLNKAEAELIKLEKELGDNEKALKGSENATDDNTNSLKKFRGSADEAGKCTLKLGDLIKGNLISEAIIGGLKSLGGAIVDIAKKFGDFVKSGIQNASDLAESQNVVDVTFKENAETINDWSKKAANAYGLSELSAKKYNGTIGAMFKSMGLADDAVLTMSMGIVGLSADFASFYNLEHDEAFEKIRSGISGETEPLKQLGINMSVANLEAYALSQGIDKAYNSMTQAEQATLRYNYLMTVSADAQGDFGRTSGSFANQQKIAQLNLENFATSIGSKLLPICNEALTIFNGMFSGTTNLSDGFSKLTDMVINLSTEFVNNVLEFAQVGGEILTQLVTGIKTMVPELAPIATEIVNILVSAIRTNISELTSAAITIIITLATSLINCLPELLKAAIEIIVALGNGITQALPTLVPAIVNAVILMVNTLLEHTPQILQAGINLLMALVEAIPRVTTELIGALPRIITSIIKALVESIPVISVAAIELFMTLVEAIPVIVVELIKELPQIVTAIIGGLEQLPGMLWNILTECINKFINWGYESEAKGEEGTKNFIKKVINIIKELPGEVWEWLKKTGDKISKFFTNAVNTGRAKANEFLNNIINVIKELPGKVWKWLKSTADKISEFFANAVNTGRAKASEFVNNVVNTIKNLPGQIGNSLTQTIQKVISWGVDLVNRGRQAASDLFNAIVNKLKELPGQMWDIGRNIVSGIWEGISNSIGGIVNKVKGFSKNILHGMESALGIHSPSKVFEERVGKNIALGVGEGFEKTMSEVKKQMQRAIPTDFNAGVNMSINYANASEKLDSIGIEGAGNYSSSSEFTILKRKENELLKELLSETREINESLCGKIVTALVEGVTLKADNREIARLIHRYV